jgi:hypothetical protein
MLLANILRVDALAHRPLAADSELARAIAVLARGHQDAVWRRTRASNELRSVLREYHPGFLAAFAGKTTNLTSPEARAVLAIASTPVAAATLTKPWIVAALRRAGRQRGIEELATRLHAALRVPHLRQPLRVEQAMGLHALTLLDMLNTACTAAERLGEATAEAFRGHPDYEVITSFPGSARPEAHGSWPRSAMTAAGSPTPVP